MCKKLSFLIPFGLMLVLSTNVQAQPTGSILIEYWNDMGGTAMSDLYGNARFPDNPDEGEYLTLFDRTYDRPTPYNDNYGARARGFLYPPETGDYTFWVASDDDSDLFLSTDDDPANKVLIAEINGWCPAYDWDNTAGSDNPNQVSAPVALEAGVKYYIEGAYKEGGGGDGIAVAWQGPGIPDRVIIDGAYLSPAPMSIVLLQAGSPNPADGAVDVDTTTIEWSAGFGAVSHRVYLSGDETIDDADLLGETNLTLQVAILDPGATYYWRVDEIDADGNVVEGNVWSFATLPLEAHFPSPADGAKSQLMDAQLSWTGGKNSIMHNIYFGTDPAMLMPVSMMQMPTSYDPGPLEVETTYYWRVDEFTPLGTIAGPVWSFTTLGSVPITDPRLMVYYSFEAVEGNLIIDQSGHSNHGQVMGDPQLVSGLLGDAMEFDGDGDYVDSGYTEDLATYTIACWVKSPAAPSGAGTSGPLHREKNYQFNWNHGNEVYQGAAAMNVGNWPAAKYGPVEADTWYFLTATFDGTSFKAYRDGVLITAVEVAGPPVAETGTMKIARHATASGAANFFTGTVDEARVYNVALTDVEILKLAKPHIADVTAPGDVVQGVPNDGLQDGSGNFGWPAAETPDLAIDDDAGTKFLHFKGNFESTGIQVEPAMGPTVVTGLTLTTANDSPERDPASFELYGSNDSLDGPYDLIAAGDVVDFIQEAEWPRFTMNATPITLENAVAYKYYQVMFPTVRDAGSANSMQIAEVELLGVPAPVAHWTFDDGAGTVALDSSGNASDGILMGDPQWVPGAWGGALEFDGIDDYVDCGNPAVLDITGDITVMCWIKVAAFTKTWETILGKGDDSYRMSRGPGTGDSIHFGANGTGDNLNANTIVTTDTWRHVALVYNGTNKIIYIDGVEDARLASSGNINSSGYNFYIGQNSQQANRYLTGLVDDVRIYNKALSGLQIRELATPSKGLIAFVSFHGADDTPSGGAAGVGFTEAADKPYTDLLTANGYDVMRVVTSSTPDADVLNLADLVIISRSVASSGYQNDGATAWNNISAPMIIVNGYVLRNSRMGYTTGGTMVDITGDIRLAVSDPAHPIFAGIELVDGTMVNPFAGLAVYPTDGTTAAGISINNNPADDEGTVLATVATVDDPTVGGMVIGEWPAGATLEHSGGAGMDVLAGPRLVFLTGARENGGKSSETAGLYDLYADGEQMFLNAVAYMLP